MAKKPKTKYTEKYKPDNFVYIVIIVILALVRFIPISLGSVDLDDAINDLAVGGSASALVAWLIDAASCNQKNKDLKTKQKLIFAEYCGAVNDLAYFIVGRCKRFSNEADEFDLEAWLAKLSDKTNYTEKMSPAITMNRAYFHLKSYTESVKLTLLSLRQQYCMLVDSDIIDTDDFRKHISLQIRICNDIIDAIELNEKEHSNAAHVVNEWIVELHANAHEIFSDEILEKYSWKTNR